MQRVVKPDYDHSSMSVKNLMLINIAEKRKHLRVYSVWRELEGIKSSTS